LIFSVALNHRSVGTNQFQATTKHIEVSVALAEKLPSTSMEADRPLSVVPSMEALASASSDASVNGPRQYCDGPPPPELSSGMIPIDVHIFSSPDVQGEPAMLRFPFASAVMFASPGATVGGSFTTRFEFSSSHLTEGHAMDVFET
jgi:hypothetical protein